MHEIIIEWLVRKVVERIRGLLKIEQSDWQKNFIPSSYKDQGGKLFARL